MKNYRVTLSEEERSTLLSMISKGKASAKKLLRARILLKADQSDNGPKWTDERISDALYTSIRTIERVRKKLVEEGFEVALGHKKPSHSRLKKLDGEKEAHLIALACSSPPEGRKRWTLRLLADKMIELNHFDSISHEAIRKTLKKMN
jgi:hypothetical protein